MIRKRFHIILRGGKWYVTIFIPLTMCNVEEVFLCLDRLNISDENKLKAIENLRCGNKDNGVTFSNSMMRETVSVFGVASNPGRCFNLIVHELHHLSVHIAKSCGYDLEEEEVCYINGDIAEYIYPICKKLIT